MSAIEKDKKSSRIKGVVHVEFPGKSPNFVEDSASKIAEWVRKLPISDNLKEELLTSIFGDKGKIT
ncbi:MAG: hypothetical protein UU16_C0022G0032 [Candidatus Woesebacteria bacterium GW2011_GWA2_40_7]|uniref:Uncharacterized protein n=3 Tax=Candidatus Woeseibacteriota TaxID=1752722 RepID=A0A0G0UY52_9BACT|nr:MAG: hypothetical protein UT17_C0002G0198 [Candidatus Woesebacteria bacterium GW2011_GWB1_39_10]KKR73410.1 MAG: hypothetical protein UU16_C0022G0032 [Candidatus Woesebacteria bacterium GW2011_GWA2_40_7]KKR92451.1 MAG: hypothetical protein UU42_C0001G0055 [Candidatus Woesebacteria bacterium GW2011_GWA1_41_13b]